ncbi:hypothetical protein KSF78_0001461 [Schistosoma japonicum]|nr:hypothetical protein KSF78_0001461 [Schistosoma japonicum]
MSALNTVDNELKVQFVLNCTENLIMYTNPEFLGINLDKDDVSKILSESELTIKRKSWLKALKSFTLEPLKVSEYKLSTGKIFKYKLSHYNELY